MKSDYLSILSKELLATNTSFVVCEIGQTTLKFQQLMYCCCPNYAPKLIFLSNGLMMPQHMFVDCFRVIFHNINFSKIQLNSSIQLIRIVSQKTERVDEFKNQIKWTFLRAFFLWNQVFFTKPVFHSMKSHLSVDWMVTEWWRNGDWMVTGKVDFSRISATIQSTEWQAHFSDLSVSLFFEK